MQVKSIAIISTFIKLPIVIKIIVMSVDHIYINCWFQGGTSFVDVFFCLVFAMPLCASVD